MPRRAPAFFLFLRCSSVCALLLLLSACSPRLLLLRGMADELASQEQAAKAETDLGLAKDASAFYLKLSESLLRQDPGNARLAESVAAGFTQYAYAFLAFEADKIESRDARAAQALRERAARMYLRARDHALRALPARPQGLRPEQVGLAYWAAAAWGGHISLSKDSPEAVADLPSAMAWASQAYALRPEFGAGDLASLMGTFELARPGGSSVQARPFFDQAISLGQGRQAGPLLAQAEGIALPAQDKAAFIALLQAAVSAAQAHPSLANELMRERALWLLGQADDLF
ncbi:hypothetical protein HNP55_003202 [Paucibacter oligotrophus]|uniref:TRAP transporter TatT component family protein n=1 Tax=Roseateles oligotrophus TaxID=1769250 RepID=A0A840LEN4_9BURK|nr:TRAP transporter TatT component family protein [Roseateles oligotrophus]MBB4844658.1 hypothetical protein [Roseateles oligotrophus]